MKNLSELPDMFKHGIKRYEESRELRDLEPPIKEYRDILEVYRDSVRLSHHRVS